MTQKNSGITQIYAPTFETYMKKIMGNFRTAVKVEWLNPDETVNFEFTNSLYDIEVNLSVNYQNGARRSCTLTLNNNKNRFPVDFNNIWFGQKFKLWMGIYIDEKTPFYFPQGVFYISNPSETYNPDTRTVTLNGVDKWAYLDGSLFGKLSETYQTNIGVNLYDALRELLRLPSSPIITSRISAVNIEDYFVVKNNTYFFEANGDAFTSNNKGIRETTARSEWTAKQDMTIRFSYNYCGSSTNPFSLKVGSKVVEKDVYSAISVVYKEYRGRIRKGESVILTYEVGSTSISLSDNREASVTNFIVEPDFPIDPIPPLLSTYFLSKNTNITQADGTELEQSVLLCPYTATVERGRTLADVILEYATILCANVYYDVHGRFTLEPMIDTADDITDTNKEILWEYSVDEKTFLGLTQTFNFDKVYNDIIVLGNIVNGYQFKGRVQNRNPISNTCVQKIGLKTKEPFEDNQYFSDEQCIELAKYYSKIDTILQKNGNISSVVLYHLDVNKLVTVSTPNNNMSKELFLITGFSLSTSGTMTVNVVSVNILKDFSVVEV